MAGPVKETASSAEDLGPEFARAAADAQAVAEEMGGAAPGAEGGEGAEKQPEPPQASNAEILGGMLSMARAVPFIAKRFPRAVACLTDEVIAENAQAVGAMMDKYGWSFGGMEAWAVEIRAAVAVGSLCLAVSDAMAEDMAEVRAIQARANSGAPGPAAGDPAPEKKPEPKPEPERQPGESWCAATPS